MKLLKNPKQIALLLALVLIFTVSTQNTIAYIVTSTPSLLNTFVPFQSLLSNLIISKEVDHPLGDDYVIPEDIAFQFRVDLGKFYAGSVIKTTAGELTADENGCIIVTAKPGSSVGIEGLDEGSVVTVTEVQADGDGFTVKDGVEQMQVTISGTASSNVDFINIYTPEAVIPATVNVNGIKILEGRDWAAGDTFAFLLEQEQGADNWVQLQTATVTYDAANPNFNTFSFTDLIQTLEFSKVGSYAFRMTEVEGDLEEMTYDKTVNYFTLHVTDKDMDGKLEIGSVTGKQNAAVTYDDTSDVYTVSVTFNNTFVPPVIPDPEDILVSLRVEKTVINMSSTKIGPEGFRFLVESLDSGETITLTTDKDGHAQMGLTFTAEDIGKTYTFKVSEINDGKTGVQYSTATYEIKITISLDEENNALAAKITKNGQSVSECVVGFENTYTKSDPISPPNSDNSLIGLWIFLMASSAAGVVCMLLLGRGRRKR